MLAFRRAVATLRPRAKALQALPMRSTTPEALLHISGGQSAEGIFVRCLFRSASSSSALLRQDVPAGLYAASDDDIENLIEDGRPVLLHCGLSWSKRSNEVAKALAEWSLAKGAGSNPEQGVSVLCVTADLDQSPRLISKRHVKGVPTVLLLRDGRVERRADAANLEALREILEAAEAYATPEETATEPRLLSATQALTAADELLRCDEASLAEPFFRRALDEDAPLGPGGIRPPNAFRARIGLLKCALLRVEQDLAQCAAKRDEEESVALDSLPSASTLAESLDQVILHHEDELPGACVSVRGDVLALAALRAHVELLVDATTPASSSTDKSAASSNEEKKILELYALGEEDEAVKAALQWYKKAAGNDITGLVASLCRPERRMSDRASSIPRRNIYARNATLLKDLAEAPGPVAPRAMLRRLFSALWPEREEVVLDALTELEFLLDRKEWVPFHTRRPYMRKGGRPHWGRGTGKRSGFSRKYWVAWGPQRTYPNTRRMGSPHSDKND